MTVSYKDGLAHSYREGVNAGLLKAAEICQFAPTIYDAENRIRALAAEVRGEPQRLKVSAEHPICEHGRNAWADDCGMCEFAGTDWAATNEPQIIPKGNRGSAVEEVNQVLGDDSVGLSESWHNLRDVAIRHAEELDRLRQRIDGYQASRDWAIRRLAEALKVEPDTVRAVEYYAEQAAQRLAEAKGLLRQAKDYAPHTKYAADIERFLNDH